MSLRMVGVCHLYLLNELDSLLTDVVAPIEREIRALANGLTSVKDEQEYIVLRERSHRNTAESTNNRVKWWSVLQAIVLFTVVAWQVYYLKVSPHDFSKNIFLMTFPSPFLK
jgi:emp24/gp25L/p24 family/GOLD